MPSNFTPLASNESENILFKSDDSENYQKPKANLNFLWIILGTIGIIFTIFTVFYVYTQPNKIKAFSSYLFNSSDKSNSNVSSLIAKQKITPTLAISSTQTNILNSKIIPTITPSPIPTKTIEPKEDWKLYTFKNLISFKYPSLFKISDDNISSLFIETPRDENYSFTGIQLYYGKCLNNKFSICPDKLETENYDWIDINIKPIKNNGTEISGFSPGWIDLENHRIYHSNIIYSFKDDLISVSYKALWPLQEDEKKFIENFIDTIQFIDNQPLKRNDL